MVAVIIPVFNRISFTLACIQSLYETTKTQFKVILIDDGSTDGTYEQINQRFKDIVIIKGDGNWWWTKSVNAGIRKASDDGIEYVILLNNDTICTEGFVDQLVGPIRVNSMVVTGALGIDAHSHLAVQTGQVINWITGKTKHYPKNQDSDYYAGLKKVTHLPGRGLAFHINLVQDIGFLDSIQFPQYLADFDFTHRARRNGYELYCNYDAKLLIYPDESGDLSNRRDKSLKKYREHLFGIKGGGNLTLFIKFALINCPRKFILIYLPLGLIRRIFGYWLR